jgi:hypothetical protein
VTTSFLLDFLLSQADFLCLTTTQHCPKPVIMAGVRGTVVYGRPELLAADMKKIMNDEEMRCDARLDMHLCVQNAR